METQTIIAGLIILAALAYVGSLLWKRARSFSRKSECADDCGCGKTRKA
jgi:hypothetical protein